MDLDAAQHEIIESAMNAKATLISGMPGSGKTTVLIETAMRLSDAPVVLVTVSRQAADRVKARIVAEHGSLPAHLQVKTVNAWAFNIMQAFAVDQDRRTPELITGPGQDAILRDLINHATFTWPSFVTEEIRQLDGFRGELRDILTRAAELGMSSAQIAQLAQEHDKPQWLLASQFKETYDHVLALEDADQRGGRGADRLDHASLVHMAATVMAQDSLWNEPRHRPTYGSILVDDYENATLATYNLLRSCQQAGSQIILTADPDVAVQTFRGGITALPGLTPATRGPGALGANTHVLRQRYRGGEQLHQALTALTSRIGTQGLVHHRHGVGHDDEDQLTIDSFPSREQELFHIARQLRRAHMEGVPYDDMAVITRSRHDHGDIERVLVEAGIAVRPLPRTQPLRYSPVVRGLMAILRAGLDMQESDLWIGLESPVMGLSAHEYRTLSRNVTTWGHAHNTQRPLADLIETDTDEPWAEPLSRYRDILQAVQQSGSNDCEQVLWHTWCACQVAEEWQDRALSDTAQARSFSQLLDDVMALFRFAQRLVDREPATDARRMLDELESQEVVEDTIARVGLPHGVHLMTPAMAVGHDFDTVIISGLNDGIWPNTKIRDGLFNTGQLADIVLEQYTGQSSRTSVIYDELRMLAFAVSRARRQLLLTCLESEEHSPSRFIDVVGQPQPNTSMPVALTMAGVVGRLRSLVADDNIASPEDQQWAARLLARLSEMDVPGADPATWAQLRQPSSTEAWDEKKRLSPSAIEDMAECTLRWFMSSIGVEDMTDRFALDRGTLIHELAELYPDGDRERMLDHFEQRWPDLIGERTGHIAQDEYEKTYTMVESLSRYLSSAPSGQLEQTVSATYGDHTIAGRIDRLEGNHIVDFKTSKTVLSKNAAQQQIQLRVYQWILSQRGIQPDGGTLVYVAKPSASGQPTTRHQDPLDSVTSAEVEQTLASVIAGTSQASLTATPNPNCRNCRFTSICPAVDGRLFS